VIRDILPESEQNAEKHERSQIEKSYLSRCCICIEKTLLNER